MYKVEFYLYEFYLIERNLNIRLDESGSTYYSVNTYYINEKLQVVGRIGETLTGLYKVLLYYFEMCINK